jgi:hypothetical protein
MFMNTSIQSDSSKCAVNGASRRHSSRSLRHLLRLRNGVAFTIQGLTQRESLKAERADYWKEPNEGGYTITPPEPATTKKKSRRPTNALPRINQAEPVARPSFVNSATVGCAEFL